MDQANDAETEPGISEIDLEVAMSRAVFAQLMSILDIYATGYIIIYSEEIDAAFIVLREFVFRAILENQKLSNVDRELIRDVLPETLGAFTGDATWGAWDEIRPMAVSLKSQFLSACLESKIPGKWISAAEDALKTMGYDSLRRDYESQKKQATEEWCLRHGIAVPWALDEMAKELSASKGRNVERSQDRKVRAKELDRAGLTRKEIAKELGISERRVYSLLSSES